MKKFLIGVFLSIFCSPLTAHNTELEYLNMPNGYSKLNLEALKYAIEKKYPHLKEIRSFVIDEMDSLSIHHIQFVISLDDGSPEVVHCHRVYIYDPKGRNNMKKQLVLHRCSSAFDSYDNLSFDLSEVQIKEIN